MSTPLWVPDADTIDQAQSTQLARHFGLATYEELLAFSVADEVARPRLADTMDTGPRQL